MFFLLSVRDSIRVAAPILLADWGLVLADEIDARYANRVLPGVGLVICLADILHCGDAVLPPGDGAAHADGAFCWSGGGQGGGAKGLCEQEWGQGSRFGESLCERGRLRLSLRLQRSNVVEGSAVKLVAVQGVLGVLCFAKRVVARVALSASAHLTQALRLLQSFAHRARLLPSPPTPSPSPHSLTLPPQ